jgi:hypothetical protein
MANVELLMKEYFDFEEWINVCMPALDETKATIREWYEEHAQNDQTPRPVAWKTGNPL